MTTKSKLTPAKQAVSSDYEAAKDRFAALGVDTEQALKRLASVPISLQCWQGDDVRGFEGARTLGGGLAVTGAYPGRARNADELRGDLEWAFKRIPGPVRLNLHASYGEFGSRRVDRDAVAPEHFRQWIAWAKERRMGLDFNPTFFSHRWSGADGTLSHPDEAMRRFWVRHGQASRHIGAAMGEALGTPCVTNLWIPDGSKDSPIDRRGPRERLLASLDEIFSEPLPETVIWDAVEPKLFGIGCESFTVGSMEFYLAYAVSRKKMICLDTGHFHPTESVADKLSAVFTFVDRILLHVSRGVRWDSDHVVTLSDDVQALAEELVRGNYLARASVGLDYFDASINRVAAWIIGARSTRKAILNALLQPIDQLRRFEEARNYTARLAMQEESKSLPSGAVWNEFCRREGVAMDRSWLPELRLYEHRVQRLRDHESGRRR